MTTQQELLEDIESLTRQQDDDQLFSNDVMEDVMDCLVTNVRPTDDDGEEQGVQEGLTFLEESDAVRRLRTTCFELRRQNADLKEVNDFVYLYNKLLIAETQRLYRKNECLARDSEAVAEALRERIRVLDYLLREEAADLKRQASDMERRLRDYVGRRIAASKKEEKKRKRPPSGSETTTRRKSPRLNNDRN